MPPSAFPGKDTLAPFPVEWLQMRMEAASLNTLDSFVGQVQLQAIEIQTIIIAMNEMMVGLQKRLSQDRWPDFVARYNLIRVLAT